VPEIVCGTAALGLPYGLPREGGKVELMPEERAQLVVERALAAGLSIFDTAPAYGEAEARLGKALRGAGVVWTKIGRGEGVDASLRRLDRAAIDLLQWHNWSADLADDAHFRRAWEELRARAEVKGLGASTYGRADALAAVKSGLFEVVQIEWNVLNQGVLAAVADEAARRGVKIALRSVFLQGALTDEGRVLPTLARLRGGVQKVRELAAEWHMGLTALALRAALDAPGASYVLVGVDSPDQPTDIRRIAQLPPLDPSRLRDVTALDLDGDPATDPRTWR
jgi:aryl-alcohol dehydrogenase-like predicted oxidoreductase